MKTPASRFAGTLAGSCFALFLGGCVMWPQFGEPAFVGPPESPILTAEQSPTDRARDNSGITHLPGQGADQADMQLIFLPRVYPDARPPEENGLSGTDTSNEDRAKGDLSAEASADTASRGDSVMTGAKPPVTVAPRGVEAEESAVRADLAEAQRLLRGFDSLDLIRSDKEKLRTVYSLIAQAEDALERRDVTPAAGLARKARLLAQELGSP
jgi:hypothetical protein